MNKTKIAQFLERYERYPCLWNPKHDDYRNNKVRLVALKSIIQEMHISISVEELKTKIKNIRTTYNREVNKIVESRRNAAGLGDVYKPQLTWFPIADRFLRSVIGGGGKDSILKRKQISSPAATSSSSSPRQEAEPVEKKKKFLSPKKCGPQTLPSVPKTPDKLESSSQNSRYDEFDTFGQHVANQLRSLPLTNAIMCQNFISNYLTQERLKILNSATDCRRDDGSTPEPSMFSLDVEENCFDEGFVKQEDNEQLTEDEY